MANEKIKSFVPVAICLSLAVISIIIRIPDFANDDFHNSDATWHVLHTLRCYDETPASIHKFLPIVTLGDEADKSITWGATIPDEYGNYYYTSFSPAGFVAPYLFMKLLHIPLSLIGLYAFNSVLYVLCFIFTAMLFCKLFKSIDKKHIWLMTAAIYLFQPEIMQGQGITYWPQSLFQLILLFQLNLLFSSFTRKKYAIMLFLCLLGAYTEWTGFCANIGIAVMYLCTDKRKWQSIGKAVGVLIATAAAFGVFSLHYLMIVSGKDFALALIARFFARNVATDTPLWFLGAGYVISFALFGLLAFVGIIWCLSMKNKRSLFWQSIKAHRWLFIVMAIALVENVIMKQHAVAYSFDRMKFIIPLIGVFFCAVEAFVLSARSADNTTHICSSASVQRNEFGRIQVREHELLCF
jgi:hypothetical protein